MQISLKNYTLRYLVFVFLAIMALWASLFYAYILEEVYDNVDDGLKNQKIEIIREAYRNPEILEIREFGVNQFRIWAADKETFSEKNKLSSQFYYMPYDDEQEPYRVLQTGFYGQDGIPYHLEIRTSTVEEDDLMLDLASALLVLYVVLVLSLYLINEFILRRAWRPFKVILDNLNHYRFGKKEDLKPIQTNVLEFNRLNQDIQQMWQRNEQVFEEQKLFLENASHELQTPLAITINKLELLMEDESLTETQLVQLADAKDSLQRMVNLNKSLLMLSRIENKQYRDTEAIDFNRLIHGLVDDLADFIAFKDINVVWQEKGTFVFTMNKGLAVILISNLLRNAIRYNHAAEGKIWIEILADSISIQNTGKVDPLPQELIFKRFHKGEQDSSSNGVGLAIVKSIIDSYKDLSITYTFEQEKHIFRVLKSFPKSFPN